MYKNKFGNKKMIYKVLNAFQSHIVRSPFIIVHIRALSFFALI